MSHEAVPQRSLTSQDTTSLAIVTTTGHAEFDGADTAGVELSDSLSPPETIAESLLAAVRVERSDDGTDSLLPPEHWIDTVMVAELVDHARKLFAERVRQGGSKSGGGGGAASSSGAGEARTAAAGAGGEDGGGGKDTASSSGSFLGTISRAGRGRLQQSSREVVAPFEVAIGGGESDGTSAAVPWSKGPDGKPVMALRKRPGRVVKLVPVEEDTKGTERSKDGSIILRDETMLRDRIYACSPRLFKCIEAVGWLVGAVCFLCGLVSIPALPFAILKFTNTTDVLFGPRVANASSAAASVVNISNITSDHDGPPWWVGG